jgi:predicted O-methyltransferase YrrM
MTKDLSANELDLRVQAYLNHFDIEPLMSHFELVGDGQKQELRNKTQIGDHLYYQWLSCLMRSVKPKQVVELGAAAGISTIAMATQLNKEAKLYSVDIDPNIAWKWMRYEYPQVTKILGDDLDMSIWPKEVDLKKTDVWFIDTLHEGKQLESELKLYSPFFKKGAIVILDDIRITEDMYKVWNDIKYDKCENTHPCHFSGFGLFVT